MPTYTTIDSISLNGTTWDLNLDPDRGFDLDLSYCNVSLTYQYNGTPLSSIFATKNHNPTMTPPYLGVYTSDTSLTARYCYMEPTITTYTSSSGSPNYVLGIHYKGNDTVSLQPYRFDITYILPYKSTRFQKGYTLYLYGYQYSFDRGDGIVIVHSDLTSETIYGGSIVSDEGADPDYMIYEDVLYFRFIMAEDSSESAPPYSSFSVVTDAYTDGSKSAITNFPSAPIVFSAFNAGPGDLCTLIRDSGDSRLGSWQQGIFQSVFLIPRYYLTGDTIIYLSGRWDT